ncbi:roadblock/LC7 domain-containing protein [Streptomyces durbertensis]|nr:roadblock/LC7 domain-containing protein [Streptomyces durbertensis]
MAVEPEVFDELRRLRARVPHLTGSLAASVDGLVLAQDTGGVEPEGLAALTAAALGVALRVTDATGRGAFQELVVRGEHGYVATYAAGPTAVLTVLAEPRANVGRLHLEARRAGARIAELAEGKAAAARRSGDGDRARTTGPARPRTEPGRSGVLPSRRPGTG